MLQIISSKDWGGDRTTLLRVPYTVIIRSKLDYDYSLLWMDRRDDSLYLDVLDLIDNQGLRLCSLVLRTYPIESFKVKTGEHSFQARRLRLSLQYYIYKTLTDKRLQPNQIF